MNNPFEDQVTTPNQESPESVVVEEEKSEEEKIKEQTQEVLGWMREQKTKRRGPIGSTISADYIMERAGKTAEELRLAIDRAMAITGHHAFIRVLQHSEKAQARLNEPGKEQDLGHFNIQKAALAEAERTVPGSYLTDPSQGAITRNAFEKVSTMEKIEEPEDYIKEMALCINEELENILKKIKEGDKNFTGTPEEIAANILNNYSSIQILRSFGESASRLDFGDIKQLVESVINELMTNFKAQLNSETEKGAINGTRDRIASM